MVFGGLRRRHGGEVGYLLEELGGVLNAVTFLVFGAVMLGPATRRDDLVDRRSTPSSASRSSACSPSGSRCSARGHGAETVAFLGWFGPRGLASIVFAVILVEEGGLPHGGVIVTTIVITVGLSVLAHGLTAAPLADRYAAWFESHPKDALPVLESRSSTHVPWRTPPAALPRSGDPGLSGARVDRAAAPPVRVPFRG